VCVILLDVTVDRFPYCMCVLEKPKMNMVTPVKFAKVQSWINRNSNRG
jgi:hypothetical protein